MDNVLIYRLYAALLNLLNTFSQFENKKLEYKKRTPKQQSFESFGIELRNLSVTSTACRLASAFIAHGITTKSHETQ